MITYTFFINLCIDTVQNTKSFWVDTLIKEENIRKPLQEFITAQTLFSKTAFRTTIEYLSQTASSLQKP
jgi:hypothetical protein